MPFYVRKINLYASVDLLDPLMYSSAKLSNICRNFLAKGLTKFSKDFNLNFPEKMNGLNLKDFLPKINLSIIINGFCKMFCIFKRRLNRASHSLEIRLSLCFANLSYIKRKCSEERYRSSAAGLTSG